jgi:predicted TIM-barrel fold metal-dependent hydrolase
MDDQGIAAEVIFAGGQNSETIPFLGTGFDAGSPAVARELLAIGGQIWNHWLADFISVAPQRLLGTIQIPIWDIDESIKILEEARGKGLTIVNLPAPRADFPAYNESDVYERFWSVVEDLGMSFVTHTGGGDAPLGADGVGGGYCYAFERFWLARRHLWQMIYGGVFERHPGIHLIFTEQMVSWVPDTLKNMDNAYLTRQRGAARDQPDSPLQSFDVLPNMPSDYWFSNCYNAGSFLAPHEVAMRSEVGTGNLLWGSDYPHHEGTWPNTLLSMRNTFAAVPQRDVRAILGENAVKAYNLDASKLRPIADKIGPKPSDLAIPPSPQEFPSHLGFAFRDFENF